MPAPTRVLNSSVDALIDSIARRNPSVEPWTRTAARKYVIRDYLTENDPLIRASDEGFPAFRGGVEHSLRRAMSELDVDRYLTRRMREENGSNSAAWIQRMETPTQRVGGLTGIYARKWNGLSPTSEVMLTDYRYTPPGLSEFLEGITREHGGDIPRPHQMPHDMAQRLGEQWTEYAISPTGVEELSPRSMRKLTADLRMGSEGEMLRSQTSALRQMAQYLRDGAQGKYDGTRFKNGMSTYLSPSVTTPSDIRSALRETDPYLEKFGSDPFRVFRDYNPVLDHITDALSADITAGRLRPEALSRLSMYDAARRTHAFDQLSQAQKDAEKVARLRADLDTFGDTGISRLHEYPEGWRWDQLLDADRAAKEAQLCNSSWCIGSPDIAQSYLDRNDLYMLRNPEGVGRALVEYNPNTRSIVQLRNRMQSGNFDDETLPYARDILRQLRPRSVSDHDLPRLRFDEDGTSWRRFMTGAD